LCPCVHACMRACVCPCVHEAQTLKALQDEQTRKEQTAKQEHDKNVATLMCLYSTFCHRNVHPSHVRTRLRTCTHTDGGLKRCAAKPAADSGITRQHPQQTFPRHPRQHPVLRPPTPRHALCLINPTWIFRINFRSRCAHTHIHTHAPYPVSSRVNMMDLPWVCSWLADQF
jgi:hypothetical protein